jgi:mono/diheme cytochrome c family protein
MIKIMKLLALLTVVCLVGVYSFVQSGIFNVAATVKDGPLITWILHTTMEKSVERRAQKIEVPDITNNELIMAGLSDYVGMCAQCHGEPDKPSSILTQGLNPAPPNLEHLTEDGTPAEMFWIINNGIRMTGMPAFGKTHQANEIWPVVAFLQAAKGISNSEYYKMKKEAKTFGHHSTGSSMNEEGVEHQHTEDDSDNEDHDVDTSMEKSSDEQRLETPSIMKKQANHAETQIEIQDQGFPEELDSKSSDSTHGDRDSHSHQH